MRYLSATELPAGWPTPPAFYDPPTGLQRYHENVEQAEFADALGFDWISVSEHHYSDRSIAPHPALTAAALAGRVKHAKLAVMGYVLPLNNPIRVAEEIAMLDNLTEGRLVVGMLRGAQSEYQTFGVNPAESRGRTLEGAELIMRALTEPQPFAWEGRYYRYRTVSVWPRPLQQPHPPLYLLGASPETGSFAAQHRLGMGYSLDRFELFHDASEHYRAQCRAAGWQPSPEQIVYRGAIHVAESDAQAGADMQRFWTKPRIPAPRTAGIRAALAQVDPIGPSHSMPGRAALSFIGSPDTIVRQVEQCRDACGAGVVDFLFQGAALDHKRVLRSMELFGREVLPRIREL